MNVGRIVRPADFEKVLATSMRSRSTHFAVHHVPGSPSRPRGAGSSPLAPGFSPDLPPELSTGSLDKSEGTVDECGHWFGLVVPKRHAKRAVTRNQLKRQLRAAMDRHATQLPPGLWVVRLRAPFDRAEFLSPASEALRAAAHAEIEQLFHQAAHAPLPPQPRRPRTPKAKAAKASTP